MKKKIRLMSTIALMPIIPLLGFVFFILLATGSPTMSSQEIGLIAAPVALALFVLLCFAVNFIWNSVPVPRPQRGIIYELHKFLQTENGNYDIQISFLEEDFNSRIINTYADFKGIKFDETPILGEEYEICAVKKGVISMKKTS
jgi:hypothetical protein